MLWDSTRHQHSHPLWSICLVDIPPRINSKRWSCPWGCCDVIAGTWWKFTFMLRPHYAWGKIPHRYPGNRRLGGIQSWSGCFGEEEIIHASVNCSHMYTYCISSFPLNHGTTGTVWVCRRNTNKIKFILQGLKERVSFKIVACAVCSSVYK